MKGGADQHTKTAAALQGGGAAPETAARSGGGSRQSACPPHVLEAIYGKVPNKKEALENSLQRWWSEYADRKNDEEDEHVADSLLYDRNHLPRTAPAPDCVQRAMRQQQQQQQQHQRQASQQQGEQVLARAP